MNALIILVWLGSIYKPKSETIYLNRKKLNLDITKSVAFEGCNHLVALFSGAYRNHFIAFGFGASKPSIGLFVASIFGEGV